jgi:hypothetical protein
MPLYSFEIFENGLKSEGVGAHASLHEMRCKAVQALAEAALDGVSLFDGQQFYEIAVREENGRIVYSAKLSLVGPLSIAAE